MRRSTCGANDPCSNLICMGFVCFEVDIRSIPFVFYAKEDEPGEILPLVKLHPDYHSITTLEQDDILEEEEDLTKVIRWRLTLAAAERWPAWVPFAEAVWVEMAGSGVPMA